MIELKVGGVYRARNGEKVEIVNYDNDPIFPFDSKCGMSYTQQGKMWTNTESTYDLIEEWHDEPKVGKWIGWNGGECPVHPDTVVEVVYSVNEEVDVWIAKLLDWSHGHHMPIVAYRVVKPHVEPREFWVKGDIAYNHGNLGGVHVREVMPDE